jgi:ligand-binding sensor domain-containing protein
MVMYEPIYRRDTHSTLPTNIVPALVVGTDGTLWLGTALGLAQLQNDVFIPHLFPQDDNPDSEVAGNPVTLEMGFLKIAQAISNAKPILSVSIGGVSFVATFGRPLIKADLIFSAIEETPHRLWVGTLGGGLRRVDVTPAGPKDKLLLTRKDGLGSNIILALAVEREGVVWAATDEGVSRLETAEEPIRITNFSALDGLQTPVKDLAIDKDGTIWLATDGGLYRIVQHDGFMQGNAQTTQESCGKS